MSEKFGPKRDMSMSLEKGYVLIKIGIQTIQKFLKNSLHLFWNVQQYFSSEDGLFSFWHVGRNAELFSFIYRWLPLFVLWINYIWRVAILVSCFIYNEEYLRNRTMFFTQCVGVKLTLIDFPVKSIIASMTEDWMSGLNFKLKRHERDVATIRLSTSNYF